MKCPIDGVDLVMSERQGVEIDYCPTCRGVWLDRGELDKILDRAAAEAVPAAPAAPATPAASYPQDTYVPPQDGYREPYRGDDHRGGDYRGDRYDDRYRDDRRGYDPRRDPRNQPYRKKKEHWLSDILDFG